MNKDFNKIVNKLLKKWWNIVLKKDVFEIIDPEFKKQNAWIVNKTIYLLKAQWYMISLKSWVYIVPESGDELLNSIDLVEKYYMKLIKKYITTQVWSHYYVSWLKSLEFHMKDNSVPERIYIINKSINKKIKVWNYEIIFKTLSWQHQWKKYNLYTLFSRYSSSITVDQVSLKTSCLELSLLESALVTDCYEWVDVSILIKAIKKYGNIMNHDVFYGVGKYKYNMSYNRLKEISKTINTDLYEVFLDVIKKNGWCFVWEGLRAI